jgi:hypothetical protein
VPVHDSEDRPFFNFPHSPPSVECPKGTARFIGAGRDADPSSLPFLVGFGFPNRHDESVAGLFVVGDVQSDQFGAEGATETVAR